MLAILAKLAKHLRGESALRCAAVLAVLVAKILPEGAAQWALPAVLGPGSTWPAAVESSCFFVRVLGRAVQLSSLRTAL
eukprot:8732045-Alexandrium_andersonii.AAC.1